MKTGFIEGFHFFYKIFSLVFFLLSSRNLKLDLFTRFISKKSRERNTVSHRSAGRAHRDEGGVLRRGDPTSWIPPDIGSSRSGKLPANLLLLSPGSQTFRRERRPSALHQRIGTLTASIDSIGELVRRSEQHCPQVIIFIHPLTHVVLFGIISCG